MSSWLPVAAAVLIWWLGTAILLVLNRYGTRISRASLLGCFTLSGVAVAGIEVSQAVATQASAYVAFASAVLLWGCLELPHLLGVLTGPVREACPAELTGWRRFRRAVGVGLYHDLLIIVVGLVLWYTLLDKPNPVAAWTFVTLWLMRWSAKLNLFLGMPNLDFDLVPEHMRYLASYMAKRAMNPLFPLSILLGVAVIWLHLDGIALATPFARTASLLLATLTLLAVLEHLLMVLPLRDSALWRWALPMEPGSSKLL